MYKGKDLTWHIEGRLGLRTKFYKHNAYWCFDVLPPYPLGTPLSYQTKQTTLNFEGDVPAQWAEWVLEAVKEDSPQWITHVEQHQRKQWLDNPRMAEWYKIPKPEGLDSEVLATKVPKEELKRYHFEVVERFDIYVDAKDARTAKLFIEEGVPRISHPALQDHVRKYHVRNSKPLTECET